MHAQAHLDVDGECGELLFTREPHCSATLVNGSLRRVAQLPPGLDAQEWLASNTADFVRLVRLFFDAVGDRVATHGVMRAAGVVYLWTEGGTYITY